MHYSLKKKKRKRYHAWLIIIGIETKTKDHTVIWLKFHGHTPGKVWGECVLHRRNTFKGPSKQRLSSAQPAKIWAVYLLASHLLCEKLLPGSTEINGNDA